MRDYDATLDALIEGTLKPEGFDHAAHLGTAHAALRRYEFFEAAHVFASGLQALTERARVPDKFNATMTLAFLSLIAERMGDEDSATFVAAHPELGRDAVLKAGYLPDRLDSGLARRVVLLP